uniref:Large ribosomal subunit protein uL29c n=1 Tax=Dermonema virens TaxID=1077399 RepID=A0A1G4NRU5_9FLOR|nr:Ribosomal protein L29 [Dermonema virens]SCW21391.1 Ribosomal protein L29 [Dermonema virens]
MISILSKEEIRSMDTSKIEEHIFEVKKVLFQFRMKQATRQSLKPHMIKKYRKQLAQIMTIQKEKIK